PNDYLSYVFGSMIEGSDANEFYTGGKSQPVPLGDLYAGDKVSKLQLLENKWLLGLDLPTPKVEGDAAKPGSTAATAVYKDFDGSLFIDGVRPTEVNQGGLGDCYFVSSLLLIARGAPEFLADAVVDNGVINGKQTWGIRFFDQYGTPLWVTVDKQLPVISASNSKLLGTSSSTGELWIPIFEKAYTQANEIGLFGREDTDNAYYAIEGGQGDTLLALTNANITVYQDFPYDQPSTVRSVFVDTKSKAKVEAAAKEIMAVLNAGGFAWIGCDRDAFDKSGKQTFVGGHAMAVFDYAPSDPNNTTVYVYNPWGVSANGDSYSSPFVVDIVTLVGGSQGLDLWLTNPILN
ncbi:MAG: C2 family cysteine protease, partial [Actinomycetes bacterium]